MEADADATASPSVTEVVQQNFAKAQALRKQAKGMLLAGQLRRAIIMYKQSLLYLAALDGSQTSELASFLDLKSFSEGEVDSEAVDLPEDFLERVSSVRQKIFEQASRALMNRMDYKRCVEFCDKGLAEQPDNRVLLLRKVDCLMREKDWQSARQFLEHLVEEFPDLQWARLRLRKVTHTIHEERLRAERSGEARRLRDLDVLLQKSM